MSSKIGAAAMGELERIYRRSLEDREGFWADAARTIDDPAVLEELELVVRGTQRASL